MTVRVSHVGELTFNDRGRRYVVVQDNKAVSMFEAWVNLDVAGNEVRFDFEGRADFYIQSELGDLGFAGTAVGSWTDANVAPDFNRPPGSEVDLSLIEPWLKPYVA